MCLGDDWCVLLVGRSPTHGFAACTVTPQDHVLGALANQRAEDAAKKSLQKPDLRDEAAEMKALEEGKAAHTTHSHRTDLS